MHQVNVRMGRINMGKCKSSCMFLRSLLVNDWDTEYLQECLEECRGNPNCEVRTFKDSGKVEKVEKVVCILHNHDNLIGPPLHFPRGGYEPVYTQLDDQEIAS